MRWWKRILTGLIILAALICILFFAFRIEIVHVEGNEIYTESEIRQSVFQKKFQNNTICFWIYQQIFGIEGLPFIEEIEVEYNSRSEVTLQVYEKAISGCIKYMGQYVYFDKDGVVLQTLGEKMDNVPVVTGIEFGTFTVGEAFYVEDTSVFNAIMNISQFIDHYGMDVRRIHVRKGEFTLYSGNVKVCLGKKNLYDDEMAALSSVLETTGKKELSGTIHMENYQSGDKIILKKDTSSGQKKSTQKKKTEK